jgi:hypothetical protein
VATTGTAIFRPVLIFIPAAFIIEAIDGFVVWGCRMRTFAIAAIIASLVMPAFAQEDPSKKEGNRYEEEKKKKNAESEKAYKDAIKRIREPEQADKKKSDPWGSIR